jgi:hypothetical protein
MSNVYKIQLMASLENAMQAWLEKQCEEGEWWPHGLVLGESTAFLMMRASFAVLEGMGDAQDFGIKEGLLFVPE